MSQVHKEQLDKIENALPNRSGADLEIFAMEGIPEDVLQAHNQRVTQDYYAAEAEHRAVTGNPAGGPGQPGQAAPVTKKPKIESAEELKKRLAEHKAKKAAQQAGQSPSGSNTPGVSFHPSPDCQESPADNITAYGSFSTTKCAFSATIRPASGHTTSSRIAAFFRSARAVCSAALTLRIQ